MDLCADTLLPSNPLEDAVLSIFFAVEFLIHGMHLFSHLSGSIFSVADFFSFLKIGCGFSFPILISSSSTLLYSASDVILPSEERLGM